VGVGVCVVGVEVKLTVGVTVGVILGVGVEEGQSPISTISKGAPYGSTVIDSAQMFSENKGAILVMFTPPTYISSESNKPLYDLVFSNFSFCAGFIMDAANFADVKSWGLSFSLLKRLPNSINSNEIIFDVLIPDKNFGISKFEEKKYYGLGKKRLSDWVRRHKPKNILDVPKLTSSINMTKKGNAKIANNYLGYMLFDSNTPRESQTKVSIFSSTYSNGQGLSIIPKNYMDCVVGFSARKLTIPDWLNWYDEYLAPNEYHELFEQFKYDSIVYSLFESKSNQSSLRQITYKEKLWDIKNEFFWMSKNEMLELSNQNNYSDLYNDARTDSDRYVYKLLFGEERIYDKLSPDAKLVLDKATELVRKSMQMREIFANDENHLKSWDAGYAQLKLIWKEYYADEFKEFRQLYKNLEDRMRPLVYELGFLLK
jgi:hypothetical protein